MRLIYLPIRAFGDFIITASVVKDNFIDKIPIILPDYLTELYSAIGSDQYFNIINTIGFNNQPAFFELYKVKDIKNLQRLLNDIRTVKSALNNKDKYILDYSSKRLFFTRANLVWPPLEENIYEGKWKQLAANNLVRPYVPVENITNEFQKQKGLEILIIPDSRIVEKSIDNRLIKLIIGYFKDFNIKIARFSQQKDQEGSEIYYSNFKGLINLISGYDLIISAESLPYHLANYLGKHHFVIYNKSRHFKTTFMTPFMKHNNYYSIFDSYNPELTIKAIEKVLYI